MKTLFLNLLLCLSASVGSAALTINVSQTGGNVLFDGSGTLDISGATPSQSPFVLPFEIILDPDNSYLFSNPSAAFNPPMDGYVLNLFNFGYGAGGLDGYNEPDAIATGMEFGLANTNFYVPAGFVSGPVNFTNTIFGTDFVTLGITPGTYEWGYPGDTITMNVIEPSVIPEPSTYLAGLGFVALGLFLWRRRAKQTA